MPRCPACACQGANLERFLRPAVLACLAAGAKHGYRILQELEGQPLFASAPPDTAGLYRTLRSLEKEGMVTSAWDAPDKGQARRLFTLTADGRDCLHRWAATLAHYADAVRALSGELTRVLEAHP